MYNIRLAWLTLILISHPLLALDEPTLNTKILGKPIPFIVPGERINLEAQLSNDTGIETARCYFRTSSANAYVFIPMKATGNNSYRCVLPAINEDVTHLEYLFLLVNGWRQVIRSEVNRLNVQFSDRVPPWQSPEEIIDPITVYSELGPIEINSLSLADDVVDFTVIENITERYGYLVDIYSADQIPSETNSAEGYFGGFILDQLGINPKPVRGFGIGLKSLLSPQADKSGKSTSLSSLPGFSTPSATPDVDGDDWAGYFETTGESNRQSLTATVNQSGSSVSIITSKSGLGHHLVGTIYSDGDMLLYDQYDGEDWTTHYGPASATKIKIYDYINNYTQLNHINIARTPKTPSSVSATDGLYLDKVAITWPGVSGADDYRVYRCATTSTNSCLNIKETTSLAHDDFGAKVNEDYYYRVKSCNKEGCSAYSNYDIGYRKRINIVPFLLPLLLDE